MFLMFYSSVDRGCSPESSVADASRALKIQQSAEIYLKTAKISIALESRFLHFLRGSDSYQGIEIWLLGSSVLLF